MTDIIINAIVAMISTFDASINKAAELLTVDIFTSVYYSTAMDVNDIVTPVALTISSLCCFIELIKISIKFDMVKYEMVFKILIKLVLARVCIDISFDILSAMYETSASWISSISTTSSISSVAATSVETALSDASFFQSLGYAMTLLPAVLAIKICGLIVRVIAYARMFELLIYLSVCALPASFLPLGEAGGEFSRISKMYFLNFASVCIQGLFIIISIQFFVALCNNTLLSEVTASTDPGEVAYTMLMGSLVLVMAVVKSGSWASKVLNA